MKIIAGILIPTLLTVSAFAKTWQIGIDLVNSAAAEYHFENKMIAGIELPFGTETTASRGFYGTKSKLVYTPGIRAGWQVSEADSSAGFVLVSLSKVDGTGTVDVGPSYPSKSTSGESLALKYSHRWYWTQFALGLGAGYRHNTITNVLVPYTTQPDFDIKMEQGMGPVFGELSVYAVF